MTDEQIDAEVAGAEDPRLIARLRHKVQRSDPCALVSLIPMVLFVGLTWNEPSAQ
jgi:hypothetical protein